MAHRAGEKEEGRARILAGAARGFRRKGFGGLGIDALAQEAGVTSGAFYAHFKSKADAFRAAVVAGMADLRAGIEALRAKHGETWRSAFIDFYLTERRTCDLGESCALQSLTAEVARAGDDVKSAWQDELEGVIEAASKGGRRADAIALLALLSGGVSMARAATDEQLGEEIARAVRRAARDLVERGK